MPFDFPMATDNANTAALERARHLKSLGGSLSVIAFAIRPYCKTMRERDEVLCLLYH